MVSTDVTRELKITIAVLAYHFNNIIWRLLSRRVLNENFNKNSFIVHNYSTFNIR